MIKVLQGDLFASQAQTLVNTVNCVGVMGKGVALQFKKRFPEMFADYERRCAAGAVKLGEPYLWAPLVPPWVLNFPTKDHWRSRTRLADIEAGLARLAACYRDWGIESLAVPPLGCGEGQLDWQVVGPTLYRELARLDIDVELYAPWDADSDELDPAFLGREIALGEVAGPTRLEPAWVALVAVLARIEQNPYRWPIGRTAFQKLAYFATAEGLPTGFQYQRGSYGPFAEDLKSVQSKLINNGLIIERPTGQRFEVCVGPTYEDAAVQHRDRLDEWEPIIERVADLLLRGDTKRTETRASVHMVAADLQHRPGPKLTEREVVDEVLKWKARRKPPLTERDVAEATRSMNILGWIRAEPADDLDLAPDITDLIESPA